MERVNALLDGDEVNRRQMLAALGSVGAAGLAGCSGNGDETPSGTDTGNQGTSPGGGGSPEEGSPTGDGSKEGSPTTEGQEGSEGYPTEENTGRWEKIIENRCDEWEDWYCLKVDDYDFLNTEGVKAGSEGGDAQYNLDEALATAVNLEVDGEESDTIYFLVNPTDIDEEREGDSTPGQISMYVNSGDWSQRQYEQTVIGNAEGIDWDDADPQAVQDAYSAFFTERIDGDGIVDHAGEIPDYAQEAFSSGWLAN